MIWLLPKTSLVGGREGFDLLTLIIPAEDCTGSRVHQIRYIPYYFHYINGEHI